MIPMVNGPDQLAVLPSTVTPGMQGRVFFSHHQRRDRDRPVGLAVAGPMADWLGVRAWYVAGGVVCAEWGRRFLRPGHPAHRGTGPESRRRDGKPGRGRPGWPRTAVRGKDGAAVVACPALNHDPATAQKQKEGRSHDVRRFILWVLSLAVLSLWACSSQKKAENTPPHAEEMPHF